MTIRGALSRIAAIVALGGAASFVIAGCAEGKSPAKKTPLPTADDKDGERDDDDDSKSAGSSSSSSNTEKSGELDPQNEAKPPSAEEPATPPTDPPVDPPVDPPANANPIAKSATCTSTKDGHKSVASMNYTLTGKVIKVTRLTIEITNKDNRNKNDINFFLTPQGGAEKKIFNSGDTLPNGATTAVVVPDNTDINAGAKVRIETNFDTSFTDPAASCAMQL